MFLPLKNIANRRNFKICVAKVVKQRIESVVKTVVRAIVKTVAKIVARLLCQNKPKFAHFKVKFLKEGRTTIE